MVEENDKLENLSFESNSSDALVEDPVAVLKKNKNKSNFTVLVFVLFTVLLTFTGYLAYYLFISKQITNTPNTIVDSGKMLEQFDFSVFDSRSDYQVQIYLSQPGRDLRYLGEGLVTEGSAVYTTSLVLGDYNPNELIVKQLSYDFNVSHIDGTVIFLKYNLISPGSPKFSNKKLKIGEDYFLRITRKESVRNGGKEAIEDIQSIYQFNIVNIDDRTYYLTNLNLSSFAQSPFEGAPVYDRQGLIVGVASGVDSNNNIKVIGGEFFYNRLKSSLSTIEEIDNKSLLGISFDFTDIETSRKEGRPYGPVVNVVTEGSIAQLGGIKVGDIVLTINNQILTSPIELDRFFDTVSPQEELKFEIIRDGKKVGITLIQE